jgi:hypothetical protein
MNLTPINKNVSRALLLTASLMTTIVQAGINLASEKQTSPQPILGRLELDKKD